MNQTDPQLPILQRVLVADDEHLVAAGVVTSVEALGFEPIGPAYDGNAALELATTHRPQLALLDIKMSGLDGIACAEKLWAEHSIPSIIVSAYSSEQYIERAQTTGIFGYLLKPASTESLRAAISIAWARASSDTQGKQRVEQLEGTLASRRLVEQAKWRLVENLGMTEPDAHTVLQRTARARRMKLSEVAQGVIENEPQKWDLDPQGPQSNQ